MPVESLLGRDGAEVGRSLLSGPGLFEVDADLLEDAPTPAPGARVVPVLTTRGRQPADHLECVERALPALAKWQPPVAVIRLAAPRLEGDAAVEVIGAVIERGSDAGVPLVFETLRGTPFGNRSDTVELLDRIRGLRLALNLAEWIVTAERLLLRDPAVLRACGRTGYVAAGVGAPQAAVVPDPRTVAARHHLEPHLAAWRRVGAAARVTAASVFVAARHRPSSLLRAGTRLGADEATDAVIEDWLLRRAVAAVEGTRRWEVAR